MPGQKIIIGGTTPRCTATFTRAASATQYTAGDAIMPATAAALLFPVPHNSSGRISGCRCVVTPASGNLVITALDFELILFRPNGNVPFADASYPADNAAMAISAAAMRERVCSFKFTNGLWVNTLGAYTADVTGYQSQGLNSPRPYAPFNTEGLTLQALRGVVQVLSAWNPGNVAQQFDFALDVDLD